MKLSINNNIKQFFKEISFKELIFYVVFALHCLIGGALAFWGLPFSPFYTSILVLGGVFLYPIKVDMILKFHVGFFLLIVVSGLFNGSSLKDFIIGLRLPIISYSMYLVVDGFFNRRRQFISLIKVVAFLQFPMVVIQLLAGDYLTKISAVPTAYHDIRYGTFFVKSDPIMSFFLITVIVYTLYRIKKKNIWDVIVLVSSSLAVFLASSRILQLVLIVILGYYLFSYSNFKQRVYALGIASILGGIIFFTGYYQIFSSQFLQLYGNMTTGQEQQIQEFTEGNYARLGAILYFLNEPIKILGDGPGSYTNPIVGEMELGLTGSNFKMYAEYGIIGLIYSVMGLLLIVFSKLKSSIYSYFIILALLALSMTSDIYNHASLMFILYLMLFVFKEAKSWKYQKIYLQLR